MKKKKTGPARQRPGLPHIHVGLRIIKTAIAVFICAIIGYLRGQPTFYAIIAAIMCLQNSSDKTLTNSLNRALGTVVGGAYGLLVLYVCRAVGVADILPVYYLLLALMIIPIILTTLAIKRPAISAFSCVVFFAITVSHIQDETPLYYALNRVLDTLVGIVVTLAVDRLLPYGKKEELREEIQATEAALEAEQEALAEETAREETAEAREGEKR